MLNVRVNIFHSRDHIDMLCSKIVFDTPEKGLRVIFSQTTNIWNSSVGDFDDFWYTGRIYYLG